MSLYANTVPVIGEKKLSQLQSTEHHTLKVPYELLNKKFRSTQKAIDRECFHINNTVTELENALNSKKKDKDQLNMLFTGVMDKLSSFKRKAADTSLDEVVCGRAVKRRIEAIRGINSQDPVTLEHWKKLRDDRLVAEYLFRTGYYKTAAELVRTRKLEKSTNLDVFETAREVEEALEKKDPVKCLLWCYDNKSKLRRVNSTLEFNIRIQEFVELIKEDRRMDAVYHARKHFASQDSCHTKSIQKVMSLLAFDYPSALPCHKKLLCENSWLNLKQQFREENLKLYQLSKDSVFCAVLQCGLSALKTPNCYMGSSAHSSDCPVCQTGFNTLALSLPFAHCSQSMLVCSISGELMNEHNTPLMLPNGHIYGRKALEKMANENNGFVICPRTNSTFNINTVKKVYVM